MITRRRALLGGAMVGAAGIVALLRRGSTSTPTRSSLVVIVREGRGDGVPAPPGRGRPRWERLRGAGLSLPLAPSQAATDELLAEVLGGAGPARGVLARLSQAGWTTLLAADAPIGPAIGATDAQLLSLPGPTAVVDALLAALSERHGDDPGRLAAVIAVMHPPNDEVFGTEVGRLLDGVAPWLVPARTVVVIIEREAKLALVVAPRRAAPPRLDGPATSAQLRALILDLFGLEPVAAGVDP